MKSTSFTIGMVSGLFVGAAASMIAENYVTPKMRRDVKRKAGQSMRAMEHIITGINDFLHD